MVSMVFSDAVAYKQKWPWQGPITPMFWRYLLAWGVPFPAKVRMVAYLCTYISMAFAFYGIVGYLAVRQH